MEELIKILDLRHINYLYLNYIDNKGNFKEVKIEHPAEKTWAEEDK